MYYGLWIAEQGYVPILTKFGTKVVLEKYLTRIFFNHPCQRGESYSQSWKCATYFVKYLGNY